MRSANRLNIRAMRISIRHVSFVFKGCLLQGQRMVLISDANENQQSTEKKEQTRGFSRGPLLVQRWRRGSSPTFHPAPAGTQTPPFFSFVFDSSKLKKLEFVKKKKKSL